jgi:predicted PurR-regulated permease PerM
VLGKRLLLNPVVIFVALMLWTFLWGIPGAILAIPMLVVLKIVCDHVARLRPLAVLLGGNGVDDVPLAHASGRVRPL